MSYNLSELLEIAAWDLPKIALLGSFQIKCKYNSIFRNR